MQDKIDLDLEPTDATEPQNIIVLTDKQIENLLNNVPFVAFKKELEELSSTQIREITNYAIIHEIANVEKVNYLKSLTDVDILKAISRNLDIKTAESK